MDVILYEKILEFQSIEPQLSDEYNQTKEHIYDLEFILTNTPSSDIIYQNVDESIFKNFHIKSVSMKS